MLFRDVAPIVVALIAGLAAFGYRFASKSARFENTSTATPTTASAPPIGSFPASTERNEFWILPRHPIETTSTQSEVVLQHWDSPEDEVRQRETDGNANDAEHEPLSERWQCNRCE